MEQLRNSNKLTEAQIARAAEEIKKLQKENKYLGAEKIIGMVSDSVGIPVKILDSISNIFGFFKK